MVRYVPRLADGQRVKLSWPLALLRLNHMYWPLDPVTSINWRRFDYLLAFVGYGIFVVHNVCELGYLRFHLNNLDAFLYGLPTYWILIEFQLRGMHVFYYSRDLQQLLQHFFSYIYVDQRKELQIFRHIERKLFPNRVVSALYLVAVSGYIVAPILMLVTQKKDFLFAMRPPFDYEPLYIFIPLTLSSVWIALIIACMEFGETALLCELITHLKGRYMLLQHNMNASIEHILTAGQRSKMARQLRELLVKTLERHVALNRFGQQLEQHFTVRMFIMFAFSAGLLCALGYKTLVSPTGSFIFPLWFGAKTIELMTLGMLGTDLAYMTDSLSSMYYHTQWERVLSESTDSRENLRLLKVIAVAIELNHKPFYLTGLKHFRVTVQSVLKILQGAFSYFTFLTSMR